MVSSSDSLSFSPSGAGVADDSGRRHKNIQHFLSWSQTYTYIHIQDSVPHIISILEVSIHDFNLFFL